MQQFVDFPTQQRVVVIFVFAAIQIKPEEQSWWGSGRAARSPSAPKCLRSGLTRFSGSENPNTSPLRSQSAARHALFLNLVAIARGCATPSRAVETVFKNELLSRYFSGSPASPPGMLLLRKLTYSRQEAVKRSPSISAPVASDVRLQCVCARSYLAALLPSKQSIQLVRRVPASG